MTATPMANEVKDALTRDHALLYDTAVARRYFAKFDTITKHLARVAAEVEKEGGLTRLEARLVGGWVGKLAATMRALSLKYLMTGRAGQAGQVAFDRHESGFPVTQELMTMALDAAQVERHLSGPGVIEIKDRMVRQILSDLTVPTDLQFALSRRLYFQALRDGGLFWARNDPDAVWVEQVGDRRHYVVHWAVWDGQTNLPVLYLMDLHDSGRKPLPEDDRRWPQTQAGLMAQSVGGLKLLTIATGFDTDFPDLHPKRLRRYTLGPMYSHAFTLQSGPIAKVLEVANAPEGEDWALVWTHEDLVADREETIKDGWFSAIQKQIWALDPLTGAETGTTRLDRQIILPERPYQVLAEQDPPGFRPHRKWVVGDGGRIIPAR